MNYLVPLVTFALVVLYSRGASLPETPDNTIVLDVAKGDNDPRSGRAEDQGEPFEIIVPVARNFSSLAELFRILKEDDSSAKEPKEARVASGPPPSYVKGTEQKASDFLIFFTDGFGKA